MKFCGFFRNIFCVFFQICGLTFILLQISEIELEAVSAQYSVCARDIACVIEDDVWEKEKEGSKKTKNKQRHGCAQKANEKTVFLTVL